ncbi:DUF2061 domain-containing protein [Cognatishimia sp. D5M38]|uniref:DUF2061 domain-containing protein n=1 Tax=Cognatishimia coralii TaxID=3083254 RepID=A0ABU8QE52_9RHOB
METRARSIVKAIVWNLIGLLIMCLVGYVATGSLTVGGAMALVNAGIGLTTYVIYERVWAQVSWGRHA